MSWSRPPITVKVWKKSYFLKSYVIDLTLSGFMSHVYIKWVIVKSVPEEFQKSCMVKLRIKSQMTIITETNFVLNPIATNNINIIPTALIKSLNIITHSLWLISYNWLTSIGSVEIWTRLANIRIRRILPANCK